jgi:hypothetical protein
MHSSCEKTLMAQEEAIDNVVCREKMLLAGMPRIWTGAVKQGEQYNGEERCPWLFRLAQFALQ